MCDIRAGEGHRGTICREAEPGSARKDPEKSCGHDSRSQGRHLPARKAKSEFSSRVEMQRPQSRVPIPAYLTVRAIGAETPVELLLSKWENGRDCVPFSSL